MEIKRPNQYHWSNTEGYSYINSFRPRPNRRHFADDIFKCIFENENEWISLRISLKFVPKVRINNVPALVQIMAWRRPGDKPLSEPMMVSLLTHICVTRPQWVNNNKDWEMIIGLIQIKIQRIVCIFGHILLTIDWFSHLNSWSPFQSKTNFQSHWSYLLMMCQMQIGKKRYITFSFFTDSSSSTAKLKWSKICLWRIDAWTDWSHFIDDIFKSIFMLGTFCHFYDFLWRIY